MQVSLRMSPGLEMWFGEWGWIDEEWFEERLTLNNAGGRLYACLRFSF
jgi:hypothetical protein